MKRAFFSLIPLKQARCLSFSMMCAMNLGCSRPACDFDPRFSTAPDAGLEAAVLAAQPGYTKMDAAAAGEDGAARFVHARVDLNGDGRAEGFAFAMGSIFCGTGGCTLMLFSQDKGGYALVREFMNSRPPVIVSPKSTHGWHELVLLESGAGGEPMYVQHSFDGKTYVETGRTPVSEVPPEGRRLLVGELGPKVGALLLRVEGSSSERIE